MSHVDVVNGRLGDHHFVERGSILVEVADFQATVAFLDVDLVVVGQALKLAGEACVSALCEKRASGVGEYLQRR